MCQSYKGFLSQNLFLYKINILIAWFRWFYFRKYFISVPMYYYNYDYVAPPIPLPHQLVSLKMLGFNKFLTSQLKFIILIILLLLSMMIKQKKVNWSFVNRLLRFLLD